MSWGSLETCLIIFHALRLLWVILVDVMASSDLFFFSSFMFHKCINNNNNNKNNKNNIYLKSNMQCI